LPAVFCLQILQVCKGDILFQIICCQIIVVWAVGICDRLLMPDFLLCSHGTGNDGIGFLLAMFGFALDFRDKSFVFWMKLCPVGSLHTLFCHGYHPADSLALDICIIPRKNRHAKFCMPV